MTRPVVDIGVACSGMHFPEWTSGVLATLLAEAVGQRFEFGDLHFGMTALPDVNKNSNAADPRDVNGQLVLPASPEDKRRNSLTDSNRVSVARGFLQGGSDYIFWMDDDTVPPRGVISHLLGLGKEFVSGVYFLGGPPFNPIAYYRTDDGTYAAVYHYTRGELKQVDSVGMGCALIHRSVYERIQAAHTVFERPNGSLVPVWNERLLDAPALADDGPAYFVSGGYLHQRLRPRPADDNRPWPFYALEYGRTEDHHFCELAANVGIRPWLDTTVECDHLKMRSIDRALYREAAKLVAKGQPA